LVNDLHRLDRLSDEDNVFEGKLQFNSKIIRGHPVTIGFERI
jgi:hypothetical protein